MKHRALSIVIALLLVIVIVLVLVLVLVIEIAIPSASTRIHFPPPYRSTTWTQPLAIRTK